MEWLAGRCRRPYIEWLTRRVRRQARTRQLMAPYASYRAQPDTDPAGEARPLDSFERLALQVIECEER